jgi:hypothetical protein
MHQRNFDQVSAIATAAGSTTAGSRDPTFRPETKCGKAVSKKVGF